MIFLCQNSLARRSLIHFPWNTSDGCKVWGGLSLKELEEFWVMRSHLVVTYQRYHSKSINHNRAPSLRLRQPEEGGSVVTNDGVSCPQLENSFLPTLCLLIKSPWQNTGGGRHKVQGGEDLGPVQCLSCSVSPLGYCHNEAGRTRNYTSLLACVTSSTQRKVKTNWKMKEQAPNSRCWLLKSCELAYRAGLRSTYTYTHRKWFTQHYSSWPVR